MLGGFQLAFSNTAIETLVGSPLFFSQALMKKGWHVAGFGQASLNDGCGQLEWLLPVDSGGDNVLPALIDNLCLDSGLRGAKVLSAAAPADSELFECLRRSGFSHYGWEVFWEFSKLAHLELQGTWIRPSSIDGPAVDTLQKNLLPAAFRTLRQISSQGLPATVFKRDGQVFGYAEVVSGSRSAVISPVLSPEIGDSPGIITTLIYKYQKEFERVYLRQTSSVSWLTTHLNEIGMPVIGRHELLVKHFTLRSKVSASELNPASKPRHADPAVPFVRSSGGRNHL